VSGAYYNEIDEYTAEWLRRLIRKGLIAPGDVDERSIEDVRPDDLRGYDQCHFFAGIGVWSHALRRAGWRDDRKVWTASCPCQPFSAAGKGDGFADERHLWPALFHLICELRPDTVLGEQVASKDGLAWIDLVRADMEAEKYAFGQFDLCAAGVGAPHIRQRLYWVADSSVSRLERQRLRHHSAFGQRAPAVRSVASGGQPGGLADSNNERLYSPPFADFHNKEHHTQSRSGSFAEGATNGFWRDVDWLACRDGKWRPVESGAFPLAHGAAARVGRLRAYGNAIVAEVAAQFILAYREVRDGPDEL
jgi:DNA (cytosine-5)-methyltransferase 1